MNTLLPLKIKPILDEVKRELFHIFNQNLKQLILFGSYARGSDEFGSDIDILMVLDKIENQDNIRKRYRDIISDICLEHDIVISIFIITEKDFKTKNLPLFMNIKKEGIKI